MKMDALLTQDIGIIMPEAEVRSREDVDAVRFTEAQYDLLLQCFRAARAAPEAPIGTSVAIVLKIFPQVIEAATAFSANHP
jgi:hypothetical protein